MARHSETYKSRELVVFVKQVSGGKSPWRVLVSGSHQGWPIGPYELKCFASEDDAATYGLKAAKWVVNHPAVVGSAAKKQAQKKKRPAKEG
jgi:hypothetical protein